MCFLGAFLYGYIQSPQEWPILLALIVIVLAATREFLPSFLVIDYDKDFIEVKLWGLWKYDVMRHRKLKTAKAIQIVCYSGGDSGYEIKKYLVFNDGEEIELPETKEIEIIIGQWYERYLHIQLPILKKGFTKGLLREWWAGRKNSKKSDAGRIEQNELRHKGKPKVAGRVR